ncbi:SCO4848 family membrane protein [Nocardioides sp.]|uniref:SCO4848 family membrane protein n=1 Tax=Nocardioides sp. TaxID=35761 RepID=UPI003D0A81E7
MKFERRHAWLLIGVALWNFFIWATFAKNLAAAHSAGEDRATGYWVAHCVLIVVNVVLGVVLGRLGLKALRAAR